MKALETHHTHHPEALAAGQAAIGRALYSANRCEEEKPVALTGL
jgi:hypothetical protein